MAENEARTFPAVVEQAAARHGDREALVDGDRRLTFAELGGRRRGRPGVRGPASSPATGWRCGRRTRGSGWSPLGAFRAGAVVVTVNTRFKGQEAAHVLRTAEARLLVTVTDFLDTDYVALLAPRRRPGDAGDHGGAARPVPGRRRRWDRFLAAGAAVDPAVVAERAAASAPTTWPPSSSPRAPPRAQGRMLRHGASVRAYTDWTDVVGLRDRRPLPDRQPVLPHVRAQRRDPGLPATGATIVPHPVFDVPSVMARVDEERITMLPGRAGDLPDDPRPPRPRPLRPVDAAAGGHRAPPTCRWR